MNKKGESPMNKKKRDMLIGGIALACIACALVIIFIFAGEKTESAFSGEGYTVVIDAGHGGDDPGAIGSSTKIEEADINLTIAKKLRNELKLLGMTVIMTRENHHALAQTKAADMQKRREIIEASNQDITVSIHQNFFEDSSVSGPQVFYAEGSAEGEKLATAIQNAMNKELLPAKNRVQKSSNYYIVQSGTAPSVIVECGFLSNTAEEALLQKKQYQLAIVRAIVEGIGNYLEEQQKGSGTSGA